MQDLGDEFVALWIRQRAEHDVDFAAVKPGDQLVVQACRDLKPGSRNFLQESGSGAWKKGFGDGESARTA